MKILNLVLMLINYLISLFAKPEPKPPEPLPEPSPTPEPKPDVPKPIPGPDGITLLKFDSELLNEHNKIREGRGKGLLLINSKLQSAAQKHAIWMAQKGIMSHTGMSGRARDAGYSYSSIGENVAAGQNDVASVISAWKWSPGHYRNMTGNYKDVGFGAASKNGKIYWCVMFGTQQKT
jgi:uncharacterized protein YkwD